MTVYPFEYTGSNTPTPNGKCTSSSSFFLYDKISTILLSICLCIMMIQLDTTYINLQKQMPQLRKPNATNTPTHSKSEPMEKTIRNPVRQASNRICKDSKCLHKCQNVTLSTFISIFFCETSEPQLFLRYNHTIILRIQNENFTSFTKWLTACNRGDFNAGCAVSYHMGASPPKYCYIMSKFSQNTLLCFNKAYGITDFIINGISFSILETKIIISTILEFIK